MKLLVCAASKYGATSEIARAVAGVLAERGCEVTVLSPDRGQARSRSSMQWCWAARSTWAIG